MMIPIITN